MARLAGVEAVEAVETEQSDKLVSPFQLAQRQPSLPVIDRRPGDDKGSFSRQVVRTGRPGPRRNLDWALTEGTKRCVTLRLDP